MTKKDFQVIASLLNRMITEKAWCMDDMQDTYNMVHMFMDELQKTNPRFDREKFAKACGV